MLWRPVVEERGWYTPRSHRDEPSAVLQPQPVPHPKTRPETPPRGCPLTVVCRIPFPIPQRSKEIQKASALLRDFWGKSNRSCFHLLSAYCVPGTPVRVPHFSHRAMIRVTVFSVLPRMANNCCCSRGTGEKLIHTQ